MTSISQTVPFGEWINTFTATPTHHSTINPTEASHLLSLVTSISKAAATQTNPTSLYVLANSMRGALARLTIISAEEVIATATSEQPQATAAIIEASLNLQSLFDADNNYNTMLSLAANVVYAVVFGLVFLGHLGLLGWSRNWYFSICFACATGLEFAGYVARIISAGNETLGDPFICQIVCLTIAPAFLMAGVYFLLAELIVIVGPKSSVMRPLWFSYIFVTCDVFSLVLQAIGGGMAAVASQEYASAKPGSRVMLTGIAFQVGTMSLFIYFFLDFYYRSKFHFQSSAPRKTSTLFAILFGTEKGRLYQKELDSDYDIRFDKQRENSPTLYHYLPLAILVGIVLVYIRCVYRVVELAQGWDGYLIRTEVFLMTLDALMIFLSCALFLVFHPAVVFGKDNNLSKAITGKYKVEEDTEGVEKDVNYSAYAESRPSDTQAEDTQTSSQSATASDQPVESIKGK